jgi:hypothetical protein
MLARRRSRSGGWRRALLLVLTAVRMAAAADPVPTSTPALNASGAGASSARDMRALLADIARRSAEENVYTGDAQIGTLRALVEDPRSTASPVLHWRRLRTLAAQELRVGETDAAVRHLEEAAALVPKLGRAVPQADVDAAQFELAVAYLRWGESRNCVARHTSESCIVPIRASGVHTDQEGSRRGIAQLEAILARQPDHLVARWLLNIASMTVGAYPDGVPEAWRIPPSAFSGGEPFPRFTDVAAQAGVNTRDLGGGAAVEDYDGDGVLDLVVSSSDPKSGLRYFAGRGDGTFRERSDEAGFTGLLGGGNVVQADYDGDGDVDLLVLRGAWLGRSGRHPKSLLRNDGKGTFTDVTFAAGLGEVHYPSQTAAFADYDGDGDLDLYVGNEGEENFRFPSQLFRNDGDGTFTDVAAAAGVAGGLMVKGVAWLDYDGDGRPDLYVSNYNEPNRLYRNRGDGTFTDVAAPAGVALPLASHTVVTGDFDDDGWTDLYVGATTPLHRPQAHGTRIDPLSPLADYVADRLGRPTSGETGKLYRNLGNGRFADVTRAWGVDRVLLSGGIGLGDVDNDGFLDLYVGTAWNGYEGLLPNVLYVNRGGRRFADATAAAGLGHLQKDAGIVLADLDGDGDQDIFDNTGGMLGGDAFGDVLFANPGGAGHWLELQLVDRRGGRSPIGARIRVSVVEDGRRRDVHRVVGTGSSFGANPLRQWVGLGKASRAETVEITWPDGRTQTLRDVDGDRRLMVVEGGDRPSD